MARQAKNLGRQRCTAERQSQFGRRTYEQREKGKTLTGQQAVKDSTQRTLLDTHRGNQWRFSKVWINDSMQKHTPSDAYLLFPCTPANLIEWDAVYSSSVTRTSPARLTCCVCCWQSRQGRGRELSCFTAGSSTSSNTSSSSSSWGANSCR